MCFGGGAKTPDSPPPAPVQSPIPSPTPSNTEMANTADQRRSKIAAMRFGMLSTIRTSPQGIVGAGADLTAQGGKKSLGA